MYVVLETPMHFAGEGTAMASAWREMCLQALDTASGIQGQGPILMLSMAFGVNIWAWHSSELSFVQASFL